MNKAVMLSIKPKYCELIANGTKIVEIRKTKPKISMPFKCYIYCTKGKTLYRSEYDRIIREVDEKYAYALGANGHTLMNGKVIGEFVCDSIGEYWSEFCESSNRCYEDIRLIFPHEDSVDDDYPDFKIVATNEEQNPSDCEICTDSCLTFEEIKKYVGLGFGSFYGWHISDLIIYDKPRYLTEFNLSRPPQSWCYVDD